MSAAPAESTAAVRARVPLAELRAVGEGDGAADLDLVARVQGVGAARDGERLGAELTVLAADGLGAGVELVEVFVRRLRDHDRGPSRSAVGVGRVERLVLGVGRVICEVDAVAAGVRADRALVLPLSKQRLVAPVGRVAGALNPGPLHVRAGVPGGVFEVRP